MARSDCVSGRLRSTKPLQPVPSGKRLSFVRGGHRLRVCALLVRAARHDGRRSRVLQQDLVRCRTHQPQSGHDHRSTLGAHAGPGYLRLPGRAGVLAGVHARRFPIWLVLRSSVPLRCLYDGAGPRRQPAVALRNLGAGRHLLLSAHRVLVRATFRCRGGQKGLRHHQNGRT